MRNLTLAMIALALTSTAASAEGGANPVWNASDFSVRSSPTTVQPVETGSVSLQRGQRPPRAVWAQAAGSTARDRSPVYQNGSNNRAGGPANELISPTGGVPVLDRSVARQQGIPSFQLGSNSRAGGPANELISPTGGVPVRTSSHAEHQRIPAFQLGSNNRAGGPANELISPTGR